MTRWITERSPSCGGYTRPLPSRSSSLLATHTRAHHHAMHIYLKPSDIYCNCQESFHDAWLRRTWGRRQIILTFSMKFGWKDRKLPKFVNINYVTIWSLSEYILSFFPKYNKTYIYIDAHIHRRTTTWSILQLNDQYVLLILNLDGQIFHYPTNHARMNPNSPIFINQRPGSPLL